MDLIRLQCMMMGQAGYKKLLVSIVLAVIIALTCYLSITQTALVNYQQQKINQNSLSNQLKLLSAPQIIKTSQLTGRNHQLLLSNAKSFNMASLSMLLQRISTKSGVKIENFQVKTDQVTNPFIITPVIMTCQATFLNWIKFLSLMSALPYVIELDQLKIARDNQFLAIQLNLEVYHY